MTEIKLDTVKFDAEQHEKLLQVVSMLLNPDQSKYLAHPFELGSNKLVLYGNPLVLKSKTKLLDILDFKELAAIPHLGTIYTITEKTTPGLVLAWLYINGLITEKDLHDLHYSLLDYLVALEWLDYFGIPPGDEFYHKTSQLMVHTVDEAKVPIDNDIKQLLTSRFPKDTDLYTAGPLIDMPPPNYSFGFFACKKITKQLLKFTTFTPVQRLWASKCFYISKDTSDQNILNYLNSK